MTSLRLDKTCSKPHGWQMGAGGKCERVKPQEGVKPKSSVSLAMPENPGLSLKEHQTRISDQLKDQKGIVVFHGTGSGKTLTAINAAEEYGGAVVVTPASLQDNFRKELEAYGAKGKYDIYSYEKFLTEKPDVSGRMLIADEAHRLRNAQTLTAKAIAEKAREANKVMLLTATPVQNRPHEVASLINIASGENLLPTNQAAFEKKFLETNVPVWKKMFVPGNVHDIGKPKNLTEFNRISSKYVDYYFPEKEGYPSVVENVINVPMSKSQVDTYRMFEARLDPNIRYKMKKNLPLDKQESSNLNAFINAQRQITNTERGFNVNSQSRSPKTMEVVDRIQMGKGKALVYSNYLESGIKDVVGELGDRQISNRVFTGKLTRKEKDEIIRDYNADKFKVLIVSSSGGEGLDLKGTRQVHVLEPHWNEEKIQQVIGRAVRYKSHEALPFDEQNVEIYRYISTFPKNVFGMKSGKMTADEYLTNLSRQKKALNEQFLGLYKRDSRKMVGGKCGKGWEGYKGRCRRVRPEPKQRNTVVVAGASIGIVGLALTGAIVVGKGLYKVDKEKPSLNLQSSLGEGGESIGDILITKKGTTEITDLAIKNKTPMSFNEEHAIRAYRGTSVYKDINRSLRSGEVSEYPPEYVEKIIGRLDSALDKLPPFDGKKFPVGEKREVKNGEEQVRPVYGKVDKLIRVARVMKSDLEGVYQEGQLITEPAFLSTSTFLSDKYMQSFATKGDPANDTTVVYEIKWKKENTSARWVSAGAFKDENEVLFKRGTSFKILEIEESDYKAGAQYGMKIVMEEV